MHINEHQRGPRARNLRLNKLAANTEKCVFREINAPACAFRALSFRAVMGLSIKDLRLMLRANTHSLTSGFLSCQTSLNKRSDPARRLIGNGQFFARSWIGEPVLKPKRILMRRFIFRPGFPQFTATANASTSFQRGNVSRVAKVTRDVAKCTSGINAILSRKYCVFISEKACGSTAGRNFMQFFNNH